ncbi:hypothetical protein HNP84_008776 [Thermocatellispora tengchongensis]|uniref:DUF2493 domain-containing protein n=1 Tax=Thermocatellispora tengchongensis TaxID=1073253 RepID=A0A840PC71_9ACTN|nr:hypothetical protein [Thermocatellispora tengchongensis]MBB5139014.1 hypothetical protein [Thermocatellispora tengchongensis]
MLRIAISGHRDLSARTADRVRTELRAILAARAGRVVGLSCLAAGADQIFAEEVVRGGGRLHAIVPAADYRQTLPPPAREPYDGLVSAAERVHRMPYARSGPEAYQAASEFMLRLADELVAVWDGLPARGRAGTAEVVAHARSAGMSVRVVWPPESERSPG